jgi:DNA-binding beta-propeller fold protein YncE
MTPRSNACRLLHAVGLALVATVAPPAGADVPVLLETWPVAGASGLVRPHDVAFDASGNVYITDYAFRQVRAFTGSGIDLRAWAFPDDPERHFAPERLAVSGDGHVYVTAPNVWWTSGLIAFTTDGAYVGLVGTKGLGPGQMVGSSGIALDAADDLYVTDDGNDRVQVLSPDGTFLRMWGSRGSGPGQFLNPAGIAVGTDGTVYVTDTGSHRIQRFTRDGTYLGEWGAYGDGPGQFVFPADVALDAAGHVYVVDHASRVQVFTSDGVFLTQWGQWGTAPGEFDRPLGIGIAPDGRIFVADTFNRRVQIFGSLATSTRPTTWGRLKRLYR